MIKLKKIFKNIIFVLFILLSSILLSLVLYFNSYFHMLYFEQLLYNFLNMENLHIISISESVIAVFLGAFIFGATFSLPFIIAGFFKDFKLKIRVLKKERQLFPVSLKWYSIILLITSIFLFFRQIGFFDYFSNQLSETNLYEDYYVEYDEKSVSFPEEKRNLIYIYVESFESSVFSIENGGLKEEAYTPNIERLAQQYTNFSNTDTLGGFKDVHGTNWTAAGMVAQTAGIPIYIKTKNDDGAYLDGAVSLGEILQENGYKNYLMMGSDANFAERKNYFMEHGNYEIFDYQYAKTNLLIPYDYFVWWGYEDSKLYKIAKDKLTYISQNDEPFNFTILTADTHYFNGYLDSSCPNVFDELYANSFYCMDLQLYQFINWIQNQDFYENTTIVIVGDHLAMRSDIFKATEGYRRTVFDLFINSKVEPIQLKNRSFTAFDMFPSTLASLGVTIEGERLALGTNLFSDKKTLIEELGDEKFAKGLRKSSKYYQEKILNEY